MELFGHKLKIIEEPSGPPDCRNCVLIEICHYMDEMANEGIIENLSTPCTDSNGILVGKIIFADNDA